MLIKVHSNNKTYSNSKSISSRIYNKTDCSQYIEWGKWDTQQDLGFLFVFDKNRGCEASFYELCVERKHIKYQL